MIVVMNFLNFLFVVTVLATSTRQVPICPEPNKILPCLCEIFPPVSGINFDCKTPKLTQESFAKAIQELRFSNPGGDGEWLSIYALKVSGTNLTTLDLTPIMNTRLDFCDLTENKYLTSITGPEPVSSFTGKIEAKHIYLSGNSLTNFGLGETLQYFAPLSVKTLYLSRNEFTESILSQIINFTNIETVELTANNLTKIQGGNFKTLGKLRIIYLGKNPLLQIIGENAFLINPNLNTFRSFIYLDKCDLTDEHLGENMALDKILAGVDVFFNDNQLKTISRAKFESMLRVGKNKIMVKGNPIFCDERVKWLKDEKEYFEEFVIDAWCINDPEATVFNSTKIPSE